MATIGKVSAVFSASTSGLTSGVNRASSSFKQLEASARSTASGVRTLVALNVAQFAGNIASAVGGYVRSLVSMGAAQAQVIDRTSKLSDRLGLSYAELSGLSLAGDLAGVSMDQIATAMTKADVALVKATKGSAQANAAFASLGLNVAELAGMNAADRFEAISAAIAALPTEAQRAAAAVALFGRSGAELLPLFNSGADALAEARAEAERLGLALTDAQGQDVEAMNDAFTLAYQTIRGIVGQVTAYLSPGLKKAADIFTKFVGDVGGANIGQAIGDAILNAARYLAEVGDKFIAGFKGVSSDLQKLIDKAETVFNLGQRAGGVLETGYRTGNFMLSNIGGFLSDATSVAMSGVGLVARVTPGLESAADGWFDAADRWAETADGFLANSNSQLSQAGAALATAIDGPMQKTAEAAAGPLKTALEQVVSQAKESAKKVVEAKPVAPPEVAQIVSVPAIEKAIRAVDSRSKEGVAEMFRLMRGGNRNVEEEQLEVQREIRDELRAGNEEPLVAEF